MGVGTRPSKEKPNGDDGEGEEREEMYAALKIYYNYTSEKTN